MACLPRQIIFWDIKQVKKYLEELHSYKRCSLVLEINIKDIWDISKYLANKHHTTK
jgi:hypothetical protein